jgi:uncharacterized protein
MTVRSKTSLGAPIWAELSTSDLDRAKDFYGAAFGWTFESPGPEYGGYVNAAKDGHLVAGLMPADPDGWSTYLRTDDVDGTIAKATAAGANSCVGAMEIPEKGFMAMLTDPSGALFGLWQPTGHQGFGAVGQPGAPVWHQLTTGDFPRALAFYREVFDWDTQLESDTDEFRYATATFDGEQLLGVMDGAAFLTDGMPAHWTCFWGSDDVDETLRIIVDNGGSVLRPAEDTPYGRLAAAADPTGAAFNLSSL